MSKIVFAYVGIFCLLVLVSANTISVTLKQMYPSAKLANASDSAEERHVPSPVEEDPTLEEDEETSKLVPHITAASYFYDAGASEYITHFLTSFHFLEIISPPPQA